VILHDASAIGDFDRGQTIAAVDTILATLTARGLRSVRVADLSPGPGENPDRRHALSGV
jgi:hypothetical protein